MCGQLGCACLYKVEKKSGLGRARAGSITFGAWGEALEQAREETDRRRLVSDGRRPWAGTGAGAAGEGVAEWSVGGKDGRNKKGAQV